MRKPPFSRRLLEEGEEGQGLRKEGVERKGVEQGETVSREFQQEMSRG